MRHYVDLIDSYDVIDGDTVRCWLDRGWGMTHYVHLRLGGLNAPEAKNTRDGGAAEKEAGLLVGRVVERWLDSRWGQLDLYHTSDAKPKFHGRTIGRLVAGWPTHTELDDTLNAYLLHERLVRAYDGGHREPWTPVELTGIIQRAEAILAR